jgi:hypothetical protein
MLAGALALVVPLAVSAQSVAVQSRISAPIDESRLMTLSGNVHPLARAENDQGKAAPTLPMERITMVFQQTAAQKADLANLLAAQQNTTSPSFHQWLTPQQYGDRFGVSQADMETVAAWLQTRGFTVVESPASRNLIVFNGTATQIEAAFHTEIHNYATGDRKFYANSAEPSVPAALAGMVSGFRGLNNYLLKPRSMKKNPMSGVPQPEFTSSISGNNFVAPGDFAMIYDLNPLYSASPAIDGTGQTIVVVGQSNVVLADIAAFRTAAGLPNNLVTNLPLTVTLVPTSTDPGVLNSTGDEQESSLDIEWSGAVAKNATIHFVYSGNGAIDALQYAVTNNLAPVISISYGGCEQTYTSAEIDAFVAAAQQANAQGTTIVSAAGDGGGTDCDSDMGNYPAILGLNVDFPSSMPYVTGVGGTEFNEGNGAYWHPQSTTDILTSALSYIPEIVWNDTLAQSQLSAGGGGASSVFGKPSWQTGTGVPADGVRDVPDVSINASNFHDSYLVCDQFQPTGSTIYTSSCLNGTFRYSDTSLQAFGGTSFGAPTLAGIVALINQKTGSAGQGNINYILYPLSASKPTAFHDISTGSGDNKSPCLSGTQDCPSGGSIGFVAGPGYDQATGLGSIDANILVTSWASVSTGSTPTLTSISPTSATAGSGPFTLTATGTNFSLTNPQILWNGSTAGVTMISGGTATSISATISGSLVAYGTGTTTLTPGAPDMVSVTDDAAKAGESSASLPFTVTSTAPLNDLIGNAIPITSFPFTSPVDNSAATQSLTDPVPPCVVGSQNPDTKTVWWSLNLTTTQSVILSTLGSAYDTTLSVWSGTSPNLVNVACNDDVSSGLYTQSLLSFTAMAGTQYYIMVAPFGPPDPVADQAGGKTVLTARLGNLNALTASPLSQTVSAGSSAMYMITNNASVPSVLTCSGLPQGTACGAVTVPANSTASLVITTTSRAMIVPPSIAKRPFHRDQWPGVLLVLGISAIALIAARRRRVFALVPLGTLAIVLILFAAGCGSSNSGTSGNPNGTPAGTYIITVTGSASQQITVTLIVN